MKKSRIKSIIVTSIVTAFIGITQVYAVSGTYNVTLPKNTPVRMTNLKTNNTDSISWNLYSVFPTGNYLFDTYSYIQIEAYSGTALLMPQTTIREGVGVTGYSYYPINLAIGDPVTFILRGNDPELDAIADIYLDWK